MSERTARWLNHFFSGYTDTLTAECVDRRLNGELTPEPAAKRIR